MFITNRPSTIIFDKYRDSSYPIKSAIHYTNLESTSRDESGRRDTGFNGNSTFIKILRILAQFAILKNFGKSVAKISVRRLLGPLNDC